MKAVDQFLYNQKRREIQERFQKLGRGAQSDCAFDLRIAHTTISRLLKGSYKSLPTLAKLEVWLNAQG